MTTHDFTDLTIEQLQNLIEQANQEQARRQTVHALEKEITAVIDKARSSGTSKTPRPGEPFEYPTDVTKAYKACETVESEGVTYISTITPNVCHPRDCKTGWTTKTE